MTEDCTHDDLHAWLEDDIRSTLAATFDDPLCRMNVLLKLVFEEYMALDDRDDVIETSEDIFEILAARALNDLNLFNHMGSA